MVRSDRNSSRQKQSRTVSSRALSAPNTTVINGKEYTLPQYGKAQQQHRMIFLYIRDSIIWVLVPILIVLGLRFFVFGLYTIPSASMESTLPVGVRVVTRRYGISAKTICRGDIIVFKDTYNWLGTSSSGAALGLSTSSKSSNNYLIKRVIGLPGDTVACAGAGEPITVNGVEIDESDYLDTEVQPSSFAFSTKVTAGNLFVMGDNRSNSSDSRYHSDDGNDGLVPISSVVGIALAVYWPISEWKSLTDGTKVFAKL